MSADTKTKGDELWTLHVNVLCSFVLFKSRSDGMAICVLTFSEIVKLIFKPFGIIYSCVCVFHNTHANHNLLNFGHINLIKVLFFCCSQCFQCG